MQYSIIIPLYNRPDEIRELLESLTKQTYKDFEVLVVEDGSEVDSAEVVKSFEDKLKLRYFTKPNEGPGQTRNFGARHAQGNYFIFFDSDCLIPEQYMQVIHDFLTNTPLDVFGGPDRAHESFTPVQKAISYSMTSFFTTGGIRGGKKKMDVFHPRSFNMGFSKDVFEKTGGFAAMRFGEDVDMSLRIIEAGYKAGLIPEAYVYHKRRTDFKKFFKQIHNSGIARINLYKRHPGSLKAVHFAPALIVLYMAFSLLGLLFGCWQFLVLLILYFVFIFFDALLQTKALNVALLSVEAAFVQHLAYGTGFLKAFWRRIVLGRDEFHAYKKNFYK